MAYSKFAMVAYGAKTSVNNAQPVWETVAENLRRYDKGLVDRSFIGVIRNEDLRTRLMKLALIVELALQEVDKIPEVKKRNVLKVFVAPEFLLRPKVEDDDRIAQYTNTEKDRAITALRFMFSDIAFAHWVFVPGSIIWGYRNPLGQLQGSLNTGMIIAGGETRYITYTKRNASVYDGIQDERYKPQNVGEALRVFEADEDLYLDKAGLKIGMEICKDHGWGLSVLKHAVNRLRDIDNQFELGIHVLTAAGQGQRNLSTTAKTGGYLLRNDGGGTYDNRTGVYAVDRQQYWDIRGFEFLQTQSNVYVRQIQQRRNCDEKTAIKYAKELGVFKDTSLAQAHLEDLGMLTTTTLIGAVEMDWTEVAEMRVQLDDEDWDPSQLPQDGRLATIVIPEEMRMRKELSDGQIQQPPVETIYTKRDKLNRKGELRIFPALDLPL